MKKLVFWICFILLISTCHSCLLILNDVIWDDNACICVTNNTEDSIKVYFASGQLPSTPTVYPDTCLPIDAYVGDLRLPHTNDSISGYLEPVAPHDTWGVFCAPFTTILGHNREERFFKCHNLNRTLSFFFIHADTLKKYGYNHVASHNLILARYDLEPSEIRALGMTVPYPPTDNMKGMKMWIPEY